jgi:CDP-paratose 2-epimerase
LKRLLVTGSSGLIGSEVCEYFSQRGWDIHGIDNNQRAILFGPEGDTRWNQKRLQESLPRFTHHEVDIRDRQGVLAVVRDVAPYAIVHAAAQPSHDRAADIPFDDFDINAVGTLNLLEAARRACPGSPFVHMSTNKVYGDAPNEISLIELDRRWEYADPRYVNGIEETFRIDQSKHSVFGASKVAADVMVQEYGRYFGIPTCCLRGGCLTGANHSGVQLHGFLSFLVKCNVSEREYQIFGYKGKQVRDNIHAYDVASFISEFINSPRVAEVYNIGGGRDNSCSILEAFELAGSISGIPMRHKYSPVSRLGDHICYISDLAKMKLHYPTWSITKGLTEIVREMCDGWQRRKC